MLILQLCCAVALLTGGVMLLAVGSLAPGLVLTVGGGGWIVRLARRL